MSKLVLYTSGSTSDPKEVVIPWETVEQHALRSINEMELTKADTVLDVFPSNTIAHYVVTSFPAQLAGSNLITAQFEPYNYIKLFEKYQPTVISLIPRHWQILTKTKGWADFDMSCVRYMIVGSGVCSQAMIDDFKSKGVQRVANWYGMTEMPPPVFVGYDSEAFDFTPKEGYAVEFAADGECIINGYRTGDVFDLVTKKFLKRKVESNGSTWKTRT